MSDAASPPLRVLAFADPEGRLWGGAVDHGTGPVLVLGAPGGSLAEPADLSLEASAGQWRLTGDGVDLTLTSDSGDDGPIELCTIAGTVGFDGRELALRCPAVRAVEAVAGPLASVRSVSGWFGDELAFGLQALRPAQVKGHESDRLTAALFEGDAATRVDEPRLSTTTLDDGLPARTSLELWIGDGDDLYPRRAAGEASGPGARSEAGGMNVIGVPLRCHSAGLDGTGVYLIAHLS